MRIDLAAAVEWLKSSDNFLILAHGNPDGDTLGGSFALLYALEALGKRAAVKCIDEPHSKFGYLGSLCSGAFAQDCVIAVDVADAALLGSGFKEMYGSEVDLCIDHHASNKEFAAMTLVDPAASAACEIVLQIIRALGVKADKRIADCIYTGISTDTGCFRYANVTPRTLRMAAEMMEAGADCVRINTVMFETKTKTFIALEKLALDSLKMYFDGRCAVITVTRDMFRESGSDEREVDAIAPIPRQIEGVAVGVTMRERSDGRFKVSMRSGEEADVSEICASLGGGGHKRASGCDVAGPLEAAVKTVTDAVGKYLKENSLI